MSKHEESRVTYNELRPIKTEGAKTINFKKEDLSDRDISNFVLNNKEVTYKTVEKTFEQIMFDSENNTSEPKSSSELESCSPPIIS